MKNTFLYIIAITVSLLLTVFSCSEKKNEKNNVATSPKSDSISSVSQPAIVVEYNALKLQVDSSWKALDKVEDDKLFVIKRLLQEVSFNPKHKSYRLNEVTKKVDDLATKRLKQDALTNLKNMDKYDELSDQVVSSVIVFKEETPNMEKYPLADDLIADLDSLNYHAVISRRGDYGKAVVEYNKFIKTNYEELSKNGVKNLNPIPGLFLEEVDSTSSDKNL